MLPNDQTWGNVGSIDDRVDSVECVQSGAGKKKSWSELKQVVCDLRRKLSSLSTMVPSSISFRRLSDGRIRIFFLSTPMNGWETTLLYADIPECTSNTNQHTRLPWQPVIESNFQSISLSSKFSREEQLMLERKRLATWGITSYELHEESGKLVFPASSTLYQCIDSGYTNGPLFPSELRLNSNGAKFLPQICPSNPDLVAYICNYDIWVCHTLTGHTQRLTYARKGGRGLADDPLVAGIPSYVMQEEFNRYQGYWWQPYSTDGIYRILYEEIDESEVKIYSFPSSSTNSCGEVEQYRFPRAGTPNSKSNLKLLEFRLSESLQITHIKNLELQYPLLHMFPWMEYLVRAGWTPNNNLCWVQLLDRRQQRLELVLISVDCFTEPPPNVYHIENHVTPTSSAAQVICVQTSDVWINVHDLLYIFPISGDGKIDFIWASEETGYRHLYLITSLLPCQANGIAERLDTTQSTVVSQMPLTSGNWEVIGRNLWVDTEHQLVYFLGLRETPLEKHLYVVSLLRPNHVRLLTKPGFSYSIDFNSVCEYLVTEFQISKTRVRAVVDTGSGATVICRRLAPFIVPLLTSMQNVGVNGQPVSILGKTKVYAQIKKGVRIPISGLVMEDISFDVILGNDFNLLYSAKIKLIERTMELTTDKTKVTVDLKLRNPNNANQILGMDTDPGQFTKPLSFSAQLHGGLYDGHLAPISLDTGGAMSVIREGLVHPLSVRRINNEAFQHVGVDNTAIMYLGITNFEFKIEGVKFSVPSLVAEDNWVHPVSLGNDFNKRFVELIDFEEQSLTLRAPGNANTVKTPIFVTRRTVQI